MAATRPVQRFETFLPCPWQKIGPIKRLVDHIDKGLCIIPKEGTDRVTLVLTREDRLDKGGEFVQSKCASDQASTSWNVDVEEKVGGNQCSAQD